MTRAHQERKPARQTLADLKPGAQIACYYEHPAPAAGAVKFRSHWVCAGCAVKVKSKDAAAAR